MSAHPLLLRVTLVKSRIGANKKVRETLDSIGLWRVQQTVIHKNILPFRGKVNRLKHYVTVQPLYWNPPSPASTEAPKPIGPSDTYELSPQVPVDAEE
eukprot:TRINITY_DN1501_c0_g2_i1.p1 TRINITY_DN1501_c0_g2~~TRINITY_DN1501_c0_g2_i1.p1  ORF type:complete len:113 (+),score=32.87 TRINITY_DN1501_c0_g2_i1:47-340(+)